MLVETLIEKLKEYPPQMEVVVAIENNNDDGRVCLSECLDFYTIPVWHGRADHKHPNAEQCLWIEG